MNILPSGSSYTFTLNAWDQLTVTSRGGTTVTGPSGLLGTVSGTSTFGGYYVDTEITIAAVMNDCQYGVTEPENAQNTTDANNNTVLVVEGGNISFLGLPRNTLAVLGTSIESQTTDATGNYLCAALPLANAAMGWPWSSIGDFGVSSDTSGPSGANPGFTSRVETIIAAGYGWCFVGFPINDCTGGLDPDAFTIPHMQAIYDQLLGAGIKVIASTGAPTSTLADTANGAYRNAYAKVQAAIRSYVETHDGIVLANTSLAMTNPATGEPFTSPATTTDGIHDNYEGAGRKAQCIVEVVSPLIKAQDTSVENPFDPRNYAINSYGLGDNASGTAGFTAQTGITGTGPNGWGAYKRATGAGVGSRADARVSKWKQPSQGARLAITAAATWDGASFLVGGDDYAGRGRYDQAWAATTAYTYGDRKKPTVANGYHYIVITPGTTGGTQPTWETTEGAFQTDGTVVWMCQKTPAAGDVFYAEAEAETSSLTASKGGVVRLTLRTVDTAGSPQQLVYSNWVDLGGSAGVPPRYLPASMRLRTKDMTLGSYNLRYLLAEVGGFGEDGASFNMDVFRVNIIRSV